MDASAAFETASHDRRARLPRGSDRRALGKRLLRRAHRAAALRLRQAAVLVDPRRRLRSGLAALERLLLRAGAHRDAGDLRRVLRARRDLLHVSLLDRGADRAARQRSHLPRRQLARGQRGRLRRWRTAAAARGEAPRRRCENGLDDGRSPGGRGWKRHRLAPRRHDRGDRGWQARPRHPVLGVLARHDEPRRRLRHLEQMDGFFDLAGIWAVAFLVSLQRRLPWVPAKRSGTKPPRRFVWGNAYGFRLPLFVLVSALVTAAVYLLTYIPFFHIGDTDAGVTGSNLAGWWDLQKAMYWYHHNLKATHPYSSTWWTWPLELRPVSYYYHVFSGVQPPNQIVAEVLALPNPFMWLAQIITVPAAGVIAWRTRHKGMMLCVAAYFFQWLPWIGSPRIDFQYNFYPDTAIICLCGAYVLHLLWRSASTAASPQGRRALVVGYLAACVLGFAFFLPVLNGAHISWKQWDARIWYKDGAPHHVGWI